MKIYSLLTQDMVIPELESTTKDDALREMGAFLKKRNKIAKDKDLYEKLLQREELGSTAIGDGVAIPHCKMKGVKNPVVMLAISKKGLDFHSLDGKPSYIFFLVVSSPDNPSVNLQILAAIAHLVRKAKRIIRKIQEAEDISMILEVLKDEEERIDD
ncbi:MAG: PTS sugar transporter subunit IIA [Candidatus Aminicenantaceae bacterium]